MTVPQGAPPEVRSGRGYYVVSLNYDYCAKHDRLVNPRFGCVDCARALTPHPTPKNP